MVTKKSSADTAWYCCGMCGETFQDPTKLLYHTYNHSQEWPHRCTFCNRGFVVLSDLTQHIKRRNAILKTYCKECAKWFQGKWCPGILGQLEGRIWCESCSTGSSPIECVTS
ncbi:hypothetical protein TNCV_3619401 [Trichonephila clavipes]|nr:hypothetical protein TNCV_3619401 [Trichonephila clavipes]